jgi:hypothetical protein
MRFVSNLGQMKESALDSCIPLHSISTSEVLPFQSLRNIETIYTVRTQLFNGMY